MSPPKQLLEDLGTGRHSHVMFLIGSAVSCSEECACASVTTICNRMLLEPIEQAHPRDLGALARRMRYDTGRDAESQELGDSISALPFEQLMGCLDAVSHPVAATVIRAGCGGSPNSRPNSNHTLIADTSTELLRTNLCTAVTVATTNYDMCLERTSAFSRLGCSTRPPPYLRVREMRVGTGRLRYVKLHGCVTDPGTCIFTMKQYAQALFDSRRAADTLTVLDNPTLVICVGYSFSDPDIRPLLRALHAGGAHFFRNKRPGRGITQSSSPPTMLRRQFLDTLRPVTYESNLFGDDNAKDKEHLLAVLATGLGIKTPPLSKFCLTTESMVKDAGKAVSSLTLNQAAEVLLRIVGSACRGDAAETFAEVIRPQWGSDDVVSMPVVRASALRLFLEQYGHRHDIDGQEEATKEMRGRYQGQHELVARAVQSFALSIRGNPRKLLPAWNALRVSKTRLKTCEPHTRALFEHYKAHLHCKFIQKLNALLPKIILRLGIRRGLKWRARRWSVQLLRATLRVRRLAGDSKDATNFIELRDVANAHLLAGQMLLLAGKLKSAEKHARFAEQYYSCSGFLNGALQADRTISWIYLARGERTRAVQAAARGLWRALETDDVSLRPKLAPRPA